MLIVLMLVLLFRHLKNANFRVHFQESIWILPVEEVNLDLAIIDGLQVVLNFIEIGRDIHSMLTPFESPLVLAKLFEKFVDDLRYHGLGLLFVYALDNNGASFDLVTGDILVDALLAAHHLLNDLLETQPSKVDLAFNVLLVDFLALLSKEINLHVAHCHEEDVYYKD
jgi:hypothetical protein